MTGLVTVADVGLVLLATQVFVSTRRWPWPPPR